MIIGYTALLYGLPYLEWAIRSVIDYLDAYYVLYTPHGSHNGNPGSLPCPDSETDLYAAAQKAAGAKLRWIRGEWRTEGEQRDSIHTYAPDARIILNLDYDEIWPDKLVFAALAAAQRGEAYRFRVPMVHFYRSFHRAILHDPAYPERIIVPDLKGGPVVTLDTPLRIAHLGYAIPMEYMKFKWSGIHGHQSQLREGWLENSYADNARRTDLHPVGSDAWNVEDVNPMDYLPSFMQSHPYYEMEIIP